MEKLGPDPARRAELEACFLSALPQIEQTIRFIARRNRLSSSEQEDFGSEVKLALIDGDYEVLARFQERSSLRTYLMVVIQRLFLDYRRKLWGKWHPSAEALRLGALAQRLEILIHRDGYSASEACEMLRTNFKVKEGREALLDLACKLPARQRARVQSLADADDTFDAVAAVAAPEDSNPHVVLQGSETVGRCQGAIDRAMEALAPDDRVVLRLRFEDDVAVVDIARMLNLDQKKLYRRIEGLLGGLRQHMESAGLGWDDVHGMIERGQCHLRLPQQKEGATAKTATARPSTVEATS